MSDQSSMNSNMITLGPVGRKYAGITWDEKGKTNICKIFITWDQICIESIQFQYAEDENLILSEKHGILGTHFFSIKLNYPHEFLTRLRGFYTADGLRSLTFNTNKKEYGPFGSTTSGFSFDFDIGPENNFGGFHGTTHNSRLASIGIHYKLTTKRTL